MKLDYISDPGHGWLKVPLRLLREWGIEGRITTFSYMRGDFAYLEEDCDASTFLDEAKRRGVAYSFRERVSRERSSKVRGYASYSNPWRGLE